MPEQNDASSQRPEPLPLAAPEPAEPCPQCSTPLPSADAVLCPSCGYDLLRLKRHETVVGRPVEVDRLGVVDAPLEGAARPGRVDESADSSHAPARPALAATPSTRVPLAIAAVCVLVLAVAALAGWSGLFPRVDGLYRDAEGAFLAASPHWTERLETVVKIAVRTLVLGVAALAAILLVARVRRSSIGDLGTVAARALAIVAAAQLFTLLSFSSRPTEMIAQLAGECALFAALVVLWFRFRLPEALQALGATLAIAVALHGFAWVVWWAT